MPTPPPVKEKTELEIMLEMHASNVPPGFSKDRENVVEVKSQQLQQQRHHPIHPHQPPPPPKPAYDMTLYSTYAAHWGPGFDPRALRESSLVEMPPVPVTIPGLGHGPVVLGPPHGPLGHPIGPIGPPLGPPGPVHGPPPLGPAPPPVTLPSSEGGPTESEPPNPEATLAALAEVVPSIGFSSDKTDENGAAKETESDEETNDVDPEELALLGIDPADFAGFGK